MSKVGTQIEREHAQVTTVKDFNDFLQFFYIYDQDKPGLEKIVFRYAENRHYTLHFGMKSKVCDIHHTREDLEPPEKYETLVRLKHTTMTRLIAGTRKHMEASQIELMPVERKLSYFRKRKWRVQRLDPETMARAGLLVKDPATRRTMFSTSLQPEDLPQLMFRISAKLLPGGYVVHSARKRGSKVIGTLHVREGNPRLLYYLPWQRQLRWASQFGSTAMAIIRRSSDKGAWQLADHLEKAFLKKT